MNSVSNTQRLQPAWLAGVRAPIVAAFRPIFVLPLKLLLPLLALSVGVAAGVAWATVRFPAAVFALCGAATVAALAWAASPAVKRRRHAAARPAAAPPTARARAPEVAAPAPAPAPAVASPAAFAPEAAGFALIGPELSLVGRLSGPGEARILGRFSGALRSARLEVGCGGAVEGEVVCDEAELFGTMTGDIRSETVVVRAGGAFRGRIAQLRFGVEAGAEVEARVTSLRRRARKVPSQAEPKV